MSTYLKKSALFPAQIKEPPAPDLGIIVVIPCYDEPDLIPSLDTLYKAESPACSVEVIIVINDSERDEEAVKKRNQATLKETQAWFNQHNNPRLKFYVLHHTNLPKRHAGVGLARKIGMDEAVYRFEAIGREDGIILCYDADSLSQANYFKAVETHFQEFPKTQACTLHFEHPLEGEEYDQEVYDSIILYELHLRYYINAKRFTGFPFAHQTIGSAMAVRCDAYQKQGGMNKRKAGEDFYFLNKFMLPGRFSEIKTTTVIPAPRTSHRVPFGTGRAISEMLESKTGLNTYHPKIFVDLKEFLKNVSELYGLKKEALKSFLSKLPLSIQSFLESQNFETKLLEIQTNTRDQKAFENRFYRWFDPFLLMKYVHHARDHFYENVPVVEAGRWLLKESFYDSEANELNAKELLLKFREEDLK